MKTPLIALLLFFLCTSSLKAQLKEFEISEMPRPDVSIVQANTAFPEDALIIVYSSFDNLSFRSSVGAVDKQYYNARANRYEILMKPLKQMIFISASEFMEQKLATINPKPKEVYYFKVEEKKTTFLPPTAPGKLTINSNPAGANISLNGIPVATKTPFSGNLNPGPTNIQLSKLKFQTFDTVMNVQSAINEVLTINLKPSTLWLNIKSNPTSAKVELDGKIIGETPLSKELDLSDKSKQGERLLKLFLTDYKTANQTIQLYPSKEPLSVIVDLKKLEGSYKIESTPEGAEIFIDGEFKGISPLQGTLPVGAYQVELKMEEYLPSSKKQLLINDKSPANLNIELQFKNHGVDSSTSELSGNGLEKDAFGKKISRKTIFFKNRMYDEFGGSDFFLSLNYERCFSLSDKVTLNARLGLGYTSLPIIGLNASIGEGKNKFEFGFTATKKSNYLILVYGLGNDIANYWKNGNIYVNPVVNYRRIYTNLKGHRKGKGGIIGISFTPFIRTDSSISFFPWLGLNVGSVF
jgi:hypothetical protein